MPIRVLIIEDDVDLRAMFRQAFVFAGFDVQVASDGVSALRVIDGASPDVIVLDLGLPLLSGHDVRREIAAQNIPIVVVTGQSGEHRDLDVACVLHKPVTPERLIAEVVKLFTVRKASAV